MQEQQQMTADQFVINETLENLGRANANQAITIANLQARNRLLEQQLQQAMQKDDKLPGEEPLEPEGTEH
jgi:hypothetical protein